MDEESEAEFIFVPNPLVRSHPIFTWIWKRCVCVYYMHAWMFVWGSWTPILTKLILENSGKLQ